MLDVIKAIGERRVDVAGESMTMRALSSKEERLLTAAFPDVRSQPGVAIDPMGDQEMVLRRRIAAVVARSLQLEGPNPTATLLDYARWAGDALNDKWPWALIDRLYEEYVALCRGVTVAAAGKP